MTENKEFGRTFTWEKDQPDNTFQYTDLQWAVIIDLLPTDVDLLEARCFCEAICQTHLMYDAMLNANRHQKKQLAKFAQTASKALEMWPSQLLVHANGPAKEGPRIAAHQYNALLELSEWANQKSKLLPPPKKGPNFFTRNLLVWRLISYWARLGGSVTTQNSPIDGKVGGKLVEFLVSAANPVLEKKLTRHAAQSEVRKFRKYNHPPYGEDFRYQW